MTDHAAISADGEISPAIDQPALDVYTELRTLFTNLAGGPHLPLSHTADQVANIAAMALRSAGLLPQPVVEAHAEFMVRWHAEDPTGIRMNERHLATAEEAHHLGPQRLGQYGITQYTVWTRRHHLLADGASWVSGWTEVPADHVTPEP